MKPEDFIGEPCTCGECRQAQVSQLPSRRDPWTGKWLHGYPLRRLYEAKQQCHALHQAIKAKAMR